MWDYSRLGRLDRHRRLLFLWMAWDFFVVNTDFGEDVLLSSREGVDELFAETGKPKGN